MNVRALWPNRRDGLWLVAALGIFGGLDLLVYGLSPPTTGWAGPHAALLSQLSVDVSLLLLVRFPVPVACWVLAVAVLMLVSDQFAPGLFTPTEPVTRAALPFATPVIATNLVRLLDHRRTVVLVGALTAVGTRFWDPSWDITPLGVVNTVLPALAALYLRARRDLLDSLRERAEREQVLIAERTRAQERRRLAEEMHDVVTHRISLMVLHAGALGVSSSEPAVRTAAEDIRQAGARALTELRELIEVVGEAHDGAEGVEAVVRHRPDLVLMDLRMPGVDGLVALERIGSMPAPPPVVALTTFDADSYVLRALRAGAVGFLVKSTPPADLVELVRVAAAGHTVLSPVATARLLAASSAGQHRDENARARLRGLTDRERDVLARLGRGLSNADIARELSLSEATVKSYVSRMLVKIDCRNRTQAGLLAREAGLGASP